MPTAVAIQCVEATTPKVPTISGRVVERVGIDELHGPASTLEAGDLKPRGPAGLEVGYLGSRIQPGISGTRRVSPAESV